MVRKLSLAAGLILATVSMVRAATPGPGPGYDIEMSRMIPMRDGTELEAWITKPSEIKGPAPAILELTQYDVDGGRRGEPPVFARRGYVFVQAYVRGRGRSGGVKSDNLGTQVGRDGYDLVEWIARQPWSNGQVAMYGGSFVGMTQWRTATQRPPHLSAIAPYVPIYPGWDVPNTNGIPQAWTAVILSYTSGRTLTTGVIGNPSYWMGKMLEQYAAQRSFIELDRAVGIAALDDWWMLDEQGRRVPMMTAWLNHVGDEAFNLAAEPRPEDYAAMRFPVLTATGGRGGPALSGDWSLGSLRHAGAHQGDRGPDDPRSRGARHEAAALGVVRLGLGPWSAAHVLQGPGRLFHDGR
jgi:predicted acyl esterase